MDLERRRRLNRNIRPDIVRNPSVRIIFFIALGCIVVFAASIGLSGALNGQVGKAMVLLDMVAFILAGVNFFRAFNYFRTSETDLFSRMTVFISSLLAFLVWIIIYIVGIFL